MSLYIKKITKHHNLQYQHEQSNIKGEINQINVMICSNQGIEMHSRIGEVLADEERLAFKVERGCHTLLL